MGEVTNELGDACEGVVQPAAAATMRKSVLPGPMMIATDRPCGVESLPHPERTYHVYCHVYPVNR